MGNHIEIHPIKTQDDEVLAKPPSLRPNYIVEVAGNNEVVSYSEPYYDRSTARKAAQGTGLPIKEFDEDGKEREKRGYTRS